MFGISLETIRSKTEGRMIDHKGWVRLCFNPNEEDIPANVKMGLVLSDGKFNIVTLEVQEKCAGKCSCKNKEMEN